MSREDESQAAPKMGKPTFAVWLIAFVGGVYYFYNKLDYIGVASIAAIGLMCFSGFRLGASRIAASLLGIAAAIAFAPHLGMSQETRFSSWFGTSGLANRFLSIAVIGLLISLVVSVIAIVITNRSLKDRPRLSWTNCWIGFFVGGAEAVVAIGLFLGGMLILEPIEKQRVTLQEDGGAESNKTSEIILKVAAKTRASQLGPYVEKYNPFTRIPQLNQIEKIQNTVQVLSDPNQINNLLRHPSITRMQQEPAMKTAVNKLMDDPEIRQILQSGKSIDREAAVKLLNHPAVLELVDQPGFLDEANKLIDDPTLFGGRPR